MSIEHKITELTREVVALRREVMLLVQHVKQPAQRSALPPDSLAKLDEVHKLVQIWKRIKL